MGGFFPPPSYFQPFEWVGVFLIRDGIFFEGRVEVWPGLHQVASASGPVHLSPEATVHAL